MDSLLAHKPEHGSVATLCLGLLASRQEQVDFHVCSHGSRNLVSQHLVDPGPQNACKINNPNDMRQNEGFWPARPTLCDLPVQHMSRGECRNNASLIISISAGDQ